MNVCILSMQRVANFGSVLQSYSLKKIIESLGHNVYFIDIIPSEEDNSLLDKCFDDYSYERDQRKGILKILDKDLPIRFINKIKFSKQVKIDKQFMKKYLHLDESGLDHYDVCVIGSDEVFNCMAQSPWGFTSQLFGNINVSEKVITYAASCGSTVAKNLPSNVQKLIRKSFLNIDGFSVRDENTKEFVKCLSDKEVLLNYDPVFIGDFSDEISKEIDINININKPYCIIYSYQNRIHSKEEITALKSFCKMKKLKIITLLDPQKWSNSYYVTSPFMVLKLFMNAQFVFTDTFHGTIMAAKYSKRYAILTRDSNRNKLGDLINKLEISNHIINSLSELNHVYKIEDDKVIINQIYNRERDRAIEYLKKNI